MFKKKSDKRQKIALHKYTKGGRVSSLLAVAAIIVIILAIIVSVTKRGEAGILVGVMGLLTFIISMTGFVIGIMSYKEETKFLKYSWIGTISNLAIWVLMLMMYLAYV